ncbi:endonuclease/exonuclease/phosphatase family protein [Actinophytocola sp.]|uniref:endonuclease/exonuclease/phosphatase family protein n=1 Tax=Actinophytocola sp. TaxID=1872138 RepID=UPI003D6C6272
MRFVTAAVTAVATALTVAAVASADQTTDRTTAAAGPSAAATQISLGTHNSHHGDGSFESFAGVIGWQEVNDPEDRRKLNRRLGGEYATFYPADGPAKAVPISWRTGRFTKVGSGSVRTHGGEAKVTPARYVNWVVLRIHGTGKRFVFVNTHFISGAWSGHPERQARWNRHYQVLKDKVAQLKRSHPGKPIFVAGDFNRRKAMAMPDPLRHVAVRGVSGVPIDQMYAPTNVSHTKVSRLPRWGSDHHAYKMFATF